MAQGGQITGQKQMFKYLRHAYSQNRVPDCTEKSDPWTTSVPSHSRTTPRVVNFPIFNSIGSLHVNGEEIIYKQTVEVPRTEFTANRVRVAHAVLWLKAWLLVKSRARTGRPQDVGRACETQGLVQKNRGRRRCFVVVDQLRHTL